MFKQLDDLCDGDESRVMRPTVRDSPLTWNMAYHQIQIPKGFGRNSQLVGHHQSITTQSHAVPSVTSAMCVNYYGRLLH